MEFEQTYRLMSTQIPGACARYNISKDALNEGVYHFISYWMYLKSMQSFSESAPFVMLNGAFKALGELYENVSGEITETRNQTNDDIRKN